MIYLGVRALGALVAPRMRATITSIWIVPTIAVHILAAMILIL